VRVSLRIIKRAKEKKKRTPQVSDFSVVLFRPHFMLVSEKNRMKVHKTQWLQAMPYSPECLSGATSRGRTMAPEV
jgi:hypothetical protein